MAKFNDATGWKRGAGVYSRSYLKTSPDQALSKSDPTLSKVKAVSKLDEVERNSARGNYSEPSLPGGPGGFSAEVSRGHRPVHKAGKRSYKRV